MTCEVKKKKLLKIIDSEIEKSKLNKKELAHKILMAKKDIELQKNLLANQLVIDEFKSSLDEKYRMETIKLNAEATIRKYTEEGKEFNVDKIIEYFDSKVKTLSAPESLYPKWIQEYNKKSDRDKSHVKLDIKNRDIQNLGLTKMANNTDGKKNETIAGKYTDIKLDKDGNLISIGGLDKTYTKVATGNQEYINTEYTDAVNDIEAARQLATDIVIKASSTKKFENKINNITAMKGKVENTVEAKDSAITDTMKSVIRTLTEGIYRIKASGSSLPATLNAITRTNETFNDSNSEYTMNVISDKLKTTKEIHAGLNDSGRITIFADGVDIDPDMKYDISPLSMLLGVSIKEITSKADGELVTSYAAVINTEGYEDIDNVIIKEAISKIPELHKVLQTTYEAGSDKESDFKETWGVSSLGFEAQENALEDITNIYMPLNMIPRAVMVSELGDSIYNALPVKYGRTVDATTADRIKTQLGILAIGWLGKVGVIQDSLVEIGVDYKDSGEVKSAKERIEKLIKMNKDDSVKITEDEMLVMKQSEITKALLISKYQDNYEPYKVGKETITPAPGSKGKISLDLKGSDGMVIFMGDDTNVDGGLSQTVIMLSNPEHPHIKSLIETGRILDSIAPNELKKTLEASAENIESKAGEDVRNSDEKLASVPVEYMDKMAKVPWKFNKMAYTIKAIWDINRDAAYIMADILNVDTAKDVSVQESRAAKNRADRDMMDLVMSKIDEFAEGEEFFIGYDFTVSGRTMMDVDANPQSNKIVRMLMNAPGMIGEINKGDEVEVKNDLEDFRISLALALGTGIDKKTDKSALEELDTIVTIDNDMNVTFKDSPKGKALAAYVKAMDEIEAADNNKAKEDAIKAIEKELRLLNEKGEGFHTIQAAHELYRLTKHNKADGVFKHSLFVEADAITSGMILTLLEIGTEDALNILEKGGVYTEAILAKWKDVAEAYGFTPENGYAVDKDGRTKITHGLLKEIGIVSKAINDEKVLASQKEILGMIQSDIEAQGKEVLADIAEESLKDTVDEKKMSILRNTAASLGTQVNAIISQIENNEKLEESRQKTIGKRDMSAIKAKLKKYITDKDGNEDFSNVMFLDMYESVAELANQELRAEQIAILKELKEKRDDIASYAGARDVAFKQTKNKETKSAGWAEVNKIKKTTDSIKREITKLKDKMAMLGLIGEVTRALAKSPVMVFIYGSSIKSIKKKLLHTIVKPSAYKMLNSDEYKDITIKEFVDYLNNKGMAASTESDIILRKMLVSGGIIKAIMVNKLDKNDEPVYVDGNPIMEFKEYAIVNQKKAIFKKYDTNTGAITTYNGAAIAKGIDSKVDIDGNIIMDQSERTLSKLHISGMMINGLKEMTDATIGEMFEKGFAKFKLVDAYRDSIKAIELVRFSTFKYKYKKHMEAYILEKVGPGIEDGTMPAEGSYTMTKSDIDEIIRRVKAEEFGHNTPDINDGKQSLTKKERSKSGPDLEVTKISYSYSRTPGKDDIRTTTGLIPTSNMVPNTGASGVITIHQKDGWVELMTTIERQVLNIFDASGTSPNLLHETNYDYNKNIAESISKFGSLDVQIADIAGRLNKMSEEEITEMLELMTVQEAQAIKNSYVQLMDKDMETIEEDTTLYSLNSIDMLNQRSANLNNRIMTFMHSYLSDKSDQYATKDGEINITRNSKNEDVVKVFNTLKKILDKTAELAVDYIPAEYDMSRFAQEGEYVNHSGGAERADITFGRIGEEYGVRSNHYYHGEPSPKNAPYGNVKITGAEFVEGSFKAGKASGVMHGRKATPSKNGLLVRNYQQVKYADAIFAIAPLADKGMRTQPNNEIDERLALNNRTVTGGTGYAVEMAIQEGKPVYVYNTENKLANNREEGWYKYDPVSDSFVKIDYIPKLTNNFAGIGSRGVDQKIVSRVVRELYENAGMNKVTTANVKERLASISHVGKVLKDFKLSEDMMEEGYTLLNVMRGGYNNGMYGNPFVEKHPGHYDWLVEIKKDGNDHRYLTHAYYNWLVNGVYPESVNNQMIEKLEKRRAAIISNESISKILDPMTKLKYLGTAVNENYSHADALYLAILDITGDREAINVASKEAKGTIGNELSNFYSGWKNGLMFEGSEFNSVEAIYQYSKYRVLLGKDAIGEKEKQAFMNARTGFDAKQLANKMKDDPKYKANPEQVKAYNSVREKQMEIILKLVAKENIDYRRKLMSIGLNKVTHNIGDYHNEWETMFPNALMKTAESLHVEGVQESGIKKKEAIIEFEINDEHDQKSNDIVDALMNDVNIDANKLFANVLGYDLKQALEINDIKRKLSNKIREGC